MHDIKSIFKELNGFPYKVHVFREMQFVSHCYTAVSCQPILRHSVYKHSGVYLSGARVRFFFRDTRFWSLTKRCHARLKERSELCYNLWCYWLIMIVQLIEQGQVVIQTGSMTNSKRNQLVLPVAIVSKNVNSLFNEGDSIGYTNLSWGPQNITNEKVERTITKMNTIKYIHTYIHAEREREREREREST